MLVPFLFSFENCSNCRPQWAILHSVSTQFSNIRAWWCRFKTHVTASEADPFGKSMSRRGALHEVKSILLHKLSGLFPSCQRCSLHVGLVLVVGSISGRKFATKSADQHVRERPTASSSWSNQGTTAHYGATRKPDHGQPWSHRARFKSWWREWKKWNSILSKNMYVVDAK